jgi:hypothetical protein
MKKSIMKGLVVSALAFSVTVYSDTTEDLVNALVTKGILTEDEAAILTKKHAGETKARDQKVKSKLSISKYLDEGKLYGDIRVRQEWRNADEYGGNESRDRSRQRYKITLGFKTKISENWFTDLALSMGSKGRSDNATLGSGGDQGNKEELFVKRAMIGWAVNDWLTLQAGRIKNPLYTKPMIWDKDLTWDGVSWKTKYKMSKQTTISTTGGVNTVTGDDTQTSMFDDDKDSQYQLSAQVIGKHKFDKKSGPSAKVGLTYTMYTNDDDDGDIFDPTNIGQPAQNALNDLSLIEIPADYKMMVKPGLGMTVFGDYAYNIDGDDRRKAWINSNGGGNNGGADDNSAFMLGLGFGSYKDFKALDKGKQKKGDWKGNLWYQEVGTYSVDPNHVDSDIFDSKVNLKGIAFKGQYMIEDNVKFNIAYAHGEINDKSVGCTPGVSGDTKMCIDTMDLLQLDVTYKW